MLIFSALFYVLTLLLAVCLPVVAFASVEITSPAPESMLVTATRSEQLVTELPYQVDLLGQQQLQRQLPRSLPEALANIPGVMVQKTSNGQGSPFIRGFTGYRTLALIDGVRYNNSVYRDGPSEYFSLIDSQSLDQIELLRGPASTLYGSDAIGGALNLHSQVPSYSNQAANQTYITGAAWTRFSSAEDSLIGRVELDAGLGESWGVSGGLSYKRFGDVDAADLGEQPTTGYDEQAWDLRVDKILNDNWATTYLHQSLKQDDVWRTHSTLYAISFAGTVVGTDLKRVKDQARQLDYLKFSGVELNGAIDAVDLTFSRQNWREEGMRIKNGGKSIEDWFDSTMWGIDIQLQSEFDSLSLVYGIDYYLDSVDTGRVDFKPDGSVDSVRIQGPVGDDSEFSQSGIYIQAALDLSDRAQITWGTRYNLVEAEVGRFEDPVSGLSASYSDHWNSWVNSLRLSLDVSDSSMLWLGASESFRAPNIADISRYGGSRSNELEIAATNLNPEDFVTYELGLKQQWIKIDVSGSIFYTDMNNYIASTPTGQLMDGLTVVTKENAASGYIRGIELSLNADIGYALGGDWSSFINTTYLDSELTSVLDASSGIEVSEPTSRLMPLTFHAGLKWQGLYLDQSLWAHVDVTYAAKADRLSSADKADTQRIPPGGTPSYTLLALRTGWDASDNLSLSIALNNVLDEAYRSHGSGTNEPGRGIDFGLRFVF